MRRRLGDSERSILAVQANLAVTYGEVGQLEKALSMERDVYSGWLKLDGEEHDWTIRAAMNYAASLSNLQRFEEAKVLLRKMIPVTRRALGEGHSLTFKIRANYAATLCNAKGATLGDLREAVDTLENLEPTVRRVFGSSHPHTEQIEDGLRKVRAALRARETPPR